MDIRLNQINVKDLGPLASFTHDLTLVNLIYGHNEMGKTCLVEFIIKSLFNNQKNWNLRGINGKGTISVSGLDSGMVEFKPNTPRKIESYWEDSDQMFPQDFSKLLVVRAGEVAFAENKNGVDSTILKNYLSGQGFLDKIMSRIKTKLQEATIEANKIIGANMGDIKILNEKEDDFFKLTNLLERIGSQLSEGELTDLKEKYNDAENKLENFMKAKRFKAFQLDSELTSVKDQLALYPKEVIEEASNKLSNWDQLSRIFSNEKAELIEAKKNSKHYAWLKKAQEIYELKHGGTLPKNSKLILIIACLSFVLSIASYFYLRNIILSVISLAVAIALIGYYIYSLTTLLKRSADWGDISDIEKGFKEKFDQSFFGLSSLKEKFEEILPSHYKVDDLEKSISEMKQELNILEQEICSLIKQFYKKNFSFGQSREILEKAKSDVETLSSQSQSLDSRLAFLGVSPEFYLPEKQIIEWDLEVFNHIQDERDNFKELIDNKEREFILLKQSACDCIGSKMTDEWDSIIWKLNNSIEEKEKEYIQIKSKCMAQILVSSLGKELQKSEEAKIQEGLRSSEVLERIKKTTNKYVDIEFSDGVLFLKDQFDKYNLSDLSTGTIEQIFLSLRIGFASKITKNKNLFLILDDAFQHSDWDRRPRLVDMVLDLANEGWQIIYFSMDDQIRDLFKQKCLKKLGKDFSLIELN
jgi:hypothetical protein